jgi:hypothetical protein
MTPQSSTAPQMSHFEQIFRLWLAGFGITEEQANKLCSDRRIANSIRAKDSGGLVQDLSGSLHGIPWDSELRKAVNSPKEKLMLMMALK